MTIFGGVSVMGIFPLLRGQIVGEQLAFHQCFMVTLGVRAAVPTQSINNPAEHARLGAGLRLRVFCRFQ